MIKLKIVEPIPGGGGTDDYQQLTNKPKINDVELVGNLTSEELGIHIPALVSELQNDRDFLNEEEIEQVGFIKDANYVHTDNNYTNEDKEMIAAMYGDYVTEERVEEIISERTSGFITKDVDDLTNYTKTSDLITTEQIQAMIDASIGTALEGEY